MEELRDSLQTVLATFPGKLVLSNPRGADCPYRRVEMVRLADGGYRVEKFTEKQAFHESVAADSVVEVLLDFYQKGLRQLNAFAEDSTFEVRVSKKGKVFVSKSAGSNGKVASVAAGHNRVKQYLIPEGTVVPPLVDMGVFTAEGRVVRSMYDKFKQINRFVEQIDDAVRAADLREMTVIDFGCGKSYLTFVLYYYLTVIRGIRVQMIGLDLKADVIAKCNAAAEKYGYDGLRFEVGDIGGFDWSAPVDMVISLHACDTATDAALFNAVRWGARMIFSVPCCQHELNAQMEAADGELSALTRFGIVRERTAALMTDAIRGDLLQACGYRTQLLEFVDLAHTPKNILIRAVRAKVPVSVRKERLAEVHRLCQQFHFEPTLLGLLDGTEWLI